MYSIKEIFYTIQGEGFHTGRPAIFVRFAGCNLWTGLEKHRESAICKFCDTEFVGTDGENGGKYDINSLIKVIQSQWPDPKTQLFIVCTGGEPALQLDQELVDALHEQNVYISIETNGTLELPKNIDWVCVSPKANTALSVIKGNELKLVYPQAEALPERFIGLDFTRFSLQPMDGENQKENTKKVIEYCKANPSWQISLQTHKILDIP